MPSSGGVAARGLSLSEDESAVFVAGGIGAGPAVWRIDTVTLSPGAAPIGSIGDNTHIAEALFLSERTVRNYVSNIFTKLQVGDRAQAIAAARDAGIGGPNRRPLPAAKAGPTPEPHGQQPSNRPGL